MKRMLARQLSDAVIQSVLLDAYGTRAVFVEHGSSFIISSGLGRSKQELCAGIDEMKPLKRR
jgi:hypothetical protein